MVKPSTVNDMYATFNGQGSKIPHTEDMGATMQQRIYHMIVGKLTELCMNRFKWRGLPSSIDERFLELTLFNQGLSVYYHDETYGVDLALRGTGSVPDMYNNPLYYNVYGNNFVAKRLPRAKVTPIYANYLRTPELPTVLIYAQRLAHLDTTIDINTRNARQPRILKAGHNTRLSVTNANRQVDLGVSTIYVDDALNPLADVEALDMGIDPDIFDKLGVTRTRTWQECMTFLGIDNANIDKKERVQTAEVESNNEQVAYMRAVNLNARQAAAKEISKKFNLNVAVDYDDDISVPMQGKSQDNAAEPDGGDL